MGWRGRHAACDSICETKDGLVPAIVFNNSSNDKNPMVFDSRRVMSVEWIVWSEIATELYG
jgi:hypothetical protein